VVLVDTSVWIEVFRKPSRVRVEQAVDFEDIVTCLPVIQEVLQGFRDERAFLLAREAMHALPIVESPIGGPVFEQAVGLYRAARRAGLTVRSGVDCLIAACALRHRLEVLHYDRDYDTLARVSPLQSRRLELR
jgi:predicted nucleic acid-binding protein